MFCKPCSGDLCEIHNFLFMQGLPLLLKRIPQIVRKLLKKHNYRRRKAQKKQTMKTAKNRNEQFENIARIKSEYETSGNPIISMDTKKKRTLATIIGMVTCILKK